MQIPNEILKCVCFIAAKQYSGKYEFKGTGFLITAPTSMPDVYLPYFVTVKHLIEGIRSTGCTTIGVRTNTTTASKWVDIPTDSSIWYSHPTEESCDLLICPFIPQFPEGLSDVFSLILGVDYIRFPDLSELDIKTFNLADIASPEFIQQNYISPGDDVFSVGLFSRYPGEDRNVPIIRTGTIASMEVDNIRFGNGGFSSGFLIESHSLGGLSGSPVFVNLEPNRLYGDILRTRMTKAFALLGLTHGHYDFNVEVSSNKSDNPYFEKINSGIAIVVPAYRIKEIIEKTPSLVAFTQFMLESVQRARARKLNA